MQIVDDDSMGMVGAVFGQMRMVGRQVRVDMRQHGQVIGGPQAQHRHQTGRPDPRQHQRRDRQPRARARADTTRQWIRDQPAGV